MTLNYDMYIWYNYYVLLYSDEKGAMLYVIQTR